MRNHSEKTRDMARSVLPSTARKGARTTRVEIHGSHRVRERQLLHQLSRALDHDDIDIDIDGDCDAKRVQMTTKMVRRRRSADKIGPLLRWAERTIEHDPKLLAGSPEDRAIYFRKILPPGLIGNHAMSHLRWVIDDRPVRWIPPQRRPTTVPLAQLAADIVAAGRHGDLNRRIRADVFPWEMHREYVPAQRLIDAEHPAPGILVPVRDTYERRRIPIRYLAGSHDIEAFARDAPWDVKAVVRTFHTEEILAGRSRTGRS